MRESPKTEGQRWLDQAKIDLHWTQHLFKEGAYYLACFLAQQTAVKALKAFLYAQGEEIVIGHSVRQLALRVSNYDADVGDPIEAWAILDSYYIPTRYPNGLPDDIPARVYNKDSAKRAVTLAEDVVSRVESWFAR